MAFSQRNEAAVEDLLAVVDLIENQQREENNFVQEKIRDL